MKHLFMIFFIVFLGLGHGVVCYGQESCLVSEICLASNIYSKTEYVYSDFIFCGKLRTKEYFFWGVRGGGINMELEGIHLKRFKELVNVVSNNYEAIVADWRTYETNEMVRFTTLSAIGFSGYNIYTNCIDRLLTFYETSSGTNGWDSIELLLGPYGTPMEAKLPLNYENPIVNNLYKRVRAIAIEDCYTNMINFCNRTLSGEWKRGYLMMEAAGAR